MNDQRVGSPGSVAAAALLLGALMLAAACDSVESSSPTRAGLEARVSEYYDCKINSNHIRRYELFDPAYRQKVKLQEFLRSVTGAAVTLSFEIKDAQIDGKEAVVTVQYQWHLSKSIPGLQNITPPVKTAEKVSKWIWVDGDWYRKAEEVLGVGARSGRAPKTAKELEKKKDTDE